MKANVELNLHMGRPTGAIFSFAANKQPCPIVWVRRLGVGGFRPALALFAALQNATKIDHVRELSPLFVLLTLANVLPIARTAQPARLTGNLVAEGSELPDLQPRTP
jgi:hypothetical protein